MHQWAATPKNILKGRWCPECARKIELKQDITKNE